MLLVCLCLTFFESADARDLGLMTLFPHNLLTPWFHSQLYLLLDSNEIRMFLLSTQPSTWQGGLNKTNYRETKRSLGYYIFLIIRE